MALSVSKVLFVVAIILAVLAGFGILSGWFALAFVAGGLLFS
jgi:hypothetical protein